MGFQGPEGILGVSNHLAQILDLQVSCCLFQARRSGKTLHIHREEGEDMRG